MNPFKQALAQGRTQIGFWQALASSYSAELCADAGFDWLLLDAEHAPNDCRSILQQLQVIAAYPCEAVVRLPIGSDVVIKQYLDIGARSILVPMVDAAEQAEEIVAATRYPPRGSRGVGSAIVRASRWSGREGYLDWAEHEICLLLQVESVRALQNLEHILAVDGIDGLFIGPADLAASMGHIGDPMHRDVQDTIERAIAAITVSGLAAGILMANKERAKAYLDMGATFVAVGTDVSTLRSGCLNLVREFKVEGGVHTNQEGSVY